MKEADITPLNKRITGKIYFLSPEGWGFISSKDKPFTRIFFHWQGLSGKAPEFKDLKKGMMVEFDLIQFGEQWRAVSIALVDK